MPGLEKTAVCVEDVVN